MILALSAVSLLWAVDPHQGAVDMLFFYLPFGFMMVRVAQLGWSASGLRAALVAQVALALLFAAVGLWQEAVHRVFWNPSVETSNAYRSFFRVNSLFWDASIYGRFLAVTLVLLAGVAIYRGMTPAVAVAMAAVFAGLYFTYSQSSYLALAAGAFALGAGVWPWRVTAGVLVAGAAAFAGILAVEVAGLEREPRVGRALAPGRPGLARDPPPPGARSRAGRVRQGSAGRHRPSVPA